MDQSDWCVEKHPSWGRNRETYEDALVSNQARDDGNSDLYVSSENKWPDSRSVLEVEPAGFSDRWMVECKGKGTIKAFCLRNWKMEFRVKLSFCKWERFISVHFSLSVVSTSLQPHGPQHTRPPCPSATPGVCSNSCPLSQWCHPTISPSVVPFSFWLQSYPASRLLSSEAALRIGWPKYCSFSFSISPSNEYSRLISFRIDWFDLLAVQGTLKSLLQYHNSKTSVHWHATFFVV